MSNWVVLLLGLFAGGLVGMVFSELISRRDGLPKFMVLVKNALARVEDQLQANKSRDRAMLDKLAELQEEMAKMVIQEEERTALPNNHPM